MTDTEHLPRTIFVRSEREGESDGICQVLAVLCYERLSFIGVVTKHFDASAEHTAHIFKVTALFQVDVEVAGSKQK